ncbi:MAG: pilus (MSHA type) biogenesis protein MshL [Piscirickettsiaceae bacterium]|nr:pilus (MSHA type) biogenesis protein MshL [Piscirickettsiaceae bacterium]
MSKHNLEHVQHVDNESHELITERVDLESEKLFEQRDKLEQKITQIQSPILEPIAIEPEYDPLDAINVTIDTDNGDVQDILRAIAEQAGMSLLLDPELAELNRQVTMHLVDVPASLVFDNVLELLDLNGEVKNNLLIVRPFQERYYSLDFLQSSGTLDYSMGGDVFGANKSTASSGSGGGGSNSNAMVGNLSLSGTGTENNNPYEQLDEMLERIIGKIETSQSSDVAIPGLATANNEESKATKPVYSLNEITGTLYVKARPSQVKVVTQLVETYKEVLSRQVLIEAQILDVRLSESFQYGVDWTLLRKELVSTYAGAAGTLGTISGVIPGIGDVGRTITLPAASIGYDATRSFGAVYSNGTFSTAVNLLQGFGTVRVLSNPSIRVKNARPAFMSVGKNTQFISESTVTVENVGGSLTTTADVTTSSAFNGIILGVETFIADDGTINLTIHPMQSEVDPNSLGLVDAGGGTKVTLPIIDFKGMVTSLSLNDGDTVIIGGLIDEVGSDTGDGLPGLADIPYIGSLFGGKNSSKQSRELVIILRVTRL